MEMKTEFKILKILKMILKMQGRSGQGKTFPQSMKLYLLGIFPKTFRHLQ